MVRISHLHTPCDNSPNIPPEYLNIPPFNTQTIKLLVQAGDGEGDREFDGDTGHW